MNADLLSLRLAMLRRGVEDVQLVLKGGQAIPDALRMARGGVEDARWFIKKVGDLAADAETSLALDEVSRFVSMLDRDPGLGDALRRRHHRLEAGRWTNALAKVAGELRTYQTQVNALTAGLEKVRKELSDIDDRVIRFGEGFGTTIGKETSALADRIESLRAEIDEGSESGSLWRTYFQEIQPRAARLFADYLDLLGGVSIRERGPASKALDDLCHLDEMCALADWYLENELTLCLEWDRSSYLALPGRDERIEVPRWPILRLGFAAWSIWGLPLAGLEFGRLVAEAHLIGEDAKRTWAPEREEFGELGLRVLVADTFAAWTEGPAYACALLFLVLDPTGEHDGASGIGVTDAERAEIVLAVLDAQVPQPTGEGARRSDHGYQYLPFVTKLGAYWRGKRARGPRSTARARLLRQLPERVVQRLRLRRPFGLEEWRVSEKVLVHLLGRGRMPDDPVPGVRHLTNAAWRGRLQNESRSNGSGAVADAWSHDLELRALAEGMALFRPRVERGPGNLANELDQIKGSPAGS